MAMLRFVFLLLAICLLVDMAESMIKDKRASWIHKKETRRTKRDIDSKIKPRALLSNTPTERSLHKGYEATESGARTVPRGPFPSPTWRIVPYAGGPGAGRLGDHYDPLRERQTQE